MQNIKYPVTVTLAGDSTWGYKGPQTVSVKNIHVEEFEENYKNILVEHDTTWEIYTDSGFESAISALLGYDVYFTEQGMQEDGWASLEA